MKLNRKHMVAGLAATGIAAGALAGGGAALAATSATPAAATATSAGLMNGHCYGPGQFGGRHAFGMRVQAGQQTVLAAAARYLGMTQTELRTQLQAGKSFADVAKAQGTPVSGLKDAILAAVTARVDANTRLTAEQKERILAQVRANLDAIVTATHPAGTGLGPVWAR